MLAAKRRRLVCVTAMVMAMPFLLADEHMNAPCEDEQSGLPCWDVIGVNKFYSDPGWPSGPAAGTCWSCLHTIQEAVLGSTFTGFTGAGTTTATCVAGTPVGTGGNKTCLPGTGPNIIYTFANVAGTGDCICTAVY